MAFLTAKLSPIRIAPDLSLKIDKMVYLTGDKYYNKSHFVRSAIIREIRRCEEELNMKKWLSIRV